MDKKYLKELELNPGATDQALAALPEGLPQDYLDFLRFANGCEGPVGEGYLRLDPVEDLAEIQKDLEVEGQLPGVFIIGSDGGGELFGIDLNFNPPKYLLVPGILEKEEILYQGTTLETLLRRIYRDEIFDPEPRGK